MTYAGYKPNETASLGAITATGIDAITKINLEREKLDAEKKIKQDELNYKAALEAQKESAKEAAELEKEKNSTKEKISKNEGKTPFTINLQANMAEVGLKHIDLDPSSQNAIMGQVSTVHALLGNQDATVAKLAENKNPSMQAVWKFERTVGDFQKQTVSTIIEGKGNDTKIIFKNDKGETISLNGVNSIRNNVENTMTKSDEDYDNWYAQIGEQQKEVGRTSKLDVAAQQNFTDKKNEIKSLILADREKLGDRYYLVSQKLGKTPIFYSEGDDLEALRVKSGAVNPEYIKMVTTQNGEMYAELTKPQQDAMKKDVDDELGIRAKKSEHTRPEGGSKITFLQQMGEAKAKETGAYYGKVIKGNNPTEAQFIRRAKAAGTMLAGTTFPYTDPNTGIYNEKTPVYQNDGKGTIKILYEDKDGNVVQYRSTPSMSRAELIRDLDGFLGVSEVKSGSEAIATTQAVTGK